MCRLWRREITRYLLRNRRYLGVSFAASHFLRLAALVGLAIRFPVPFRSELDVFTLAGGGLAYAFIAAMTLTSSDRAQSWLGRRRWRRLHLLGSGCVWIVFAQSYLSRAASDRAYLPYLLVLIAALGLRASAKLRTPLRASSSPLA